MNDYTISSHFLLRRLHSLLGLLPVGAFLMFHLWENSKSRYGMEYYNQEVVAALQQMNYLVLFEIFFIALPLLFHAGYGLIILRSGSAELKRYPWLHNHFYWLQRVSGVGILIFLLMHVSMTRIWGLWDTQISADLYSHMQQTLGNPAFLLFYLLGLLLSVFHLGNGLWTMGIVWGLTVSASAQRFSFICCMAFSGLLLAMGLQGLWGFLA